MKNYSIMVASKLPTFKYLDEAESTMYQLEVCSEVATIRTHPPLILTKCVELTIWFSQLWIISPRKPSLLSTDWKLYALKDRWVMRWFIIRIHANETWFHIGHLPALCRHALQCNCRPVMLLTFAVVWLPYNMLASIRHTILSVSTKHWKSRNLYLNRLLSNDVEPSREKRLALVALSPSFGHSGCFWRAVNVPNTWKNYKWICI